MSFWKRLLGTEPVDPDIQRAVDEQLEAFVQEQFTEKFAQLHAKDSLSEEQARTAMAMELAVNFEPGVRKAAVHYIATAARLRLPAEKRDSADPAVERALERSADAAFQQDRVAKIAVRQIYSVRGT